jgi:branched-chain amino acid transport system ATP-binding protein
MAAPLLSVRQVSKHFGGFTALSQVSLAIAPGERFGLIGPNGSGKTTLINCISGSLRNDGGSIEFEGEEISSLPAYQRTRKGIARSFQVPRPFHSMTVLENLLVPYEYVVHLKEAEAQQQAMDILRRIGLAEKAQTHSNQLSQVELRKLELARAMAAKPRLLISDEAMAGQNSFRPERFRYHDHHDRAHHAGGDALLAARDLPRRRQDHLRGHAERHRGEPRSAEGLPWRLGSTSGTWKPAMARFALCMEFRSPCKPVPRSRY